MTGENTISKPTHGRSSFETLLAINIQSIGRLYELSLNDNSMLKEAEREARKCMTSDEDILKDELKKELAKSKLLLRKKFPIRYKLKVLKALWPRLTYRQK